MPPRGRSPGTWGCRWHRRTLQLNVEQGATTDEVLRLLAKLSRIFEKILVVEGDQRLQQCPLATTAVVPITVVGIGHLQSLRKRRQAVLPCFSIPASMFFRSW